MNNFRHRFPGLRSEVLEVVGKVTNLSDFSAARCLRVQGEIGRIISTSVSVESCRSRLVLSSPRSTCSPPVPTLELLSDLLYFF